MSIADQEIKSIELEHVGPIEHLSIPIPEGGGIVVLHGASGCGKTHAIQAVRALHDQGARKSLRASDGVPSGKIEGLGVTVRLGRSNTSRGELVCESLDSGVDPSLLVDPGLKDPVAADSKRLATLVRLSGVKIQPEQWLSLCGDLAGEIAVAALVDPDPVVTADKIRRRLHDLALSKERIAESKAAESATLKKSVADIDLGQLDNERDLSSAINAAQIELTRAETQRHEWARQNKAREETLRQLAELRDGAMSVEECANEKERLNEEAKESAFKIEAAQAAAARAESLLTSARQAVKDANASAQALADRHRLACQQFDHAKQQAARIVALEQSLGDVLIDCPTDALIEKLEARKAEAIAASQQGEVVRRARAQVLKADALAAESESDSKSAEKMRNLARSTDQVLEQALINAGFDAIKVYDGRLCVESERGLEPVSELSTGERWRLALDLAARGLHKGALLSVQQEGWQSLDHGLRRDVAGMARERGLVIVTAEVDAGSIRAEVL